jgi:hypothetical protein
MKTILTGILFIFLASSCVTASKVDRWLDRHPLHEATRCADKFPCVTTGIDVKVDSTAYKKALDSVRVMIDALDSLIRSRNNIPVVPARPVPDEDPVAVPVVYADGIEPLLRELDALRRLVSRIPAVTIDTTRKIKDSAETKKLLLTVDLYKDSTNYFRGQANTFEKQATVAKSKLRSLWTGIIFILLLLIVIAVFIMRAKGVLSLIPFNLFRSKKV